MTKSRVSKRRMRMQIETILAVFEKFDDARLYELERVAKLSSQVDGWPAGGSGSGGTEVSNPTLNAVVQLLTRKPAQDPRQAAAEAVAGAIETCWREIVRAERSQQVFYKAAVEKFEHGSEFATCECCGRDVMCTAADPRKSGYCMACYSAWRRDKANGRGDRLHFEINRREWLAAEAEKAQEVSA